MRPSVISAVFRKYERDSGIVGVAYGPKEVGGNTTGNPNSVSFFVREKLPYRGARRRLADGRRRLPKKIELNGVPVPTDVVVANVSATGPGTANAPRFRTGGKISNQSLTGTFGCLVTAPGSQKVYALTNQHIALDPGKETFFPDAFTPGGVIGLTDKSVELVADEEFLGVIDKPGTYIDVDAALVAIPKAQLAKFSTDTPKVGRPAGIFEPDRTTFESYSNSLLDRPVFAFSWKTNLRKGRISHIFYALRKLPDHTESVASFVIQSTDGSVPGQVGDSGKVWMTKDGDRTLAVGLHSGVVTESSGARFAIVTELSSLAAFFGFELYSEP